MAQIALKNAAGKDAGTVDLDDATFAIQPNVPVMHQVVTAQLAARRSGTQSTKTRSTVRGGGRKPYRQKGTGNARQGSTRAPHYSGGAVALGPQPRKYNQKTPKKMISLALRSALSDRAGEGRVVVVDAWGWDKPSTKAAVKALAGLGVDGRVLVVVGRDDAAAALSFRNLPEVQLIAPGELNAYDVLCNDWVVFTQDLLPTFTGSAKALATQPATATETETSADMVDEIDEIDEIDQVDDQVDEVDEIDQVDEIDEAAVPATFASLATDEIADEVLDAAGSTIHPYGAGSHTALRDGAQPEGYPIKGNAASMLYHLPGSAFYDRTNAEVWFATEADAEAAGFARPESQQGADAPDPGETTADAVSVQPYGAGSYVALAGDAQPEGFAIKGNANSMLYHTPDSAFYDRTNAEVWFATEADAEAAGFSKPASQKDDD